MKPMKKSSMLALFLALLTLLALTPLSAWAGSLRESLAKLSNSELLELQQALQEEMESRGLASSQQEAVRTTRSLGEVLVWIPKSGTKYHDTATCSNMKNPSQVSLDVAKELGFTPCKKCAPPK